MRKPVLIGGGLGLLSLLVLGAALWLWQGEGRTGYSTTNSPLQAPRIAGASVAPVPTLQNPAMSSMPGPLGSAASSAQGVAAHGSGSLGTEERRKRLSQIRTELAAITAQGAQASPERVQALLTELEVLSQGRFDPRYFQALREMLEGSGQVQALNRELQGLGSSTAPKDVARKQAILAELQAISARIGAAAANVQAYARRPAAQGSTP